MRNASYVAVDFREHSYKLQNTLYSDRSLVDKRGTSLRPACLSIEADVAYSESCPSIHPVHYSLESGNNSVPSKMCKVFPFQLLYWIMYRKCRCGIYIDVRTNDFIRRSRNSADSSSSIIVSWSEETNHLADRGGSRNCRCCIVLSWFLVYNRIIAPICLGTGIYIYNDVFTRLNHLKRAQ